LKTAKSGEKEVSSRLFDSSNESVAIFLRALFDTDGYISKRGKEIEYCTKSEKLAFQVASLLRTRFGIVPSLQTYFKKTTNSSMASQLYWRLFIKGESVDKYMQEINFNDPQKRAIGMDVLNKCNHNTNIDVLPVGKIIKQIREESGLTAPQLARLLDCSKQLIYEYEKELYALSRRTLKRYILALERLRVKNSKLDFLKWLIDSDFSFRRVNKIIEETYDKPYVYDLQVCEGGGHFVHASGIIVSNTFIVANLGIALEKIGKKVIMVDADLDMANLELVLGMEGRPITLQDVLNGEAQLADAMYDAYGAKFIPAGISPSRFRRVDPEKLAKVISELAGMADVVLLDCPAGVGKDTIACLASCKEAVLIVAPEPMAVTDAYKTKIVAEKMGSEVIGLVVNMIKGIKNELSDKEITTLLECPILAKINEEPLVRECIIAGKPIVKKYPDDPAAASIFKLATTLTGATYIPEAPKKSIFQKLFGFLRRK
jgi:septum site-determining protein MinD